MPLNSPAFINGLIAAETPPKNSVALAAKGFVDAFSVYVATSSAGGIPVIPATCYLPSTQSALKGGIIAAFSLAAGPLVANAIGLAILAYFNAGPASAFFPSAVGAVTPVPLLPFMAGISAPVSQQNIAKAAIAAAITSWLGAGSAGFAIVLPGGPPPVLVPVL